jgi:hypothetical protein
MLIHVVTFAIQRRTPLVGSASHFAIGVSVDATAECSTGMHLDICLIWRIVIAPGLHSTERSAF